jgi:hypothetical protein
MDHHACDRGCDSPGDLATDWISPGDESARVSVHVNANANVRPVT